MKAFLALAGMLTKRISGGTLIYRINWTLVTEPDGTVIGPTLLFTASPQDYHLPSKHVLQKDYEYCYTIEALDYDKQLSISNTVCIKRKFPRQSDQLYISSVITILRVSL